MLLEPLVSVVAVVLDFADPPDPAALRLLTRLALVTRHDGSWYDGCEKMLNVTRFFDASNLLAGLRPFVACQWHVLLLFLQVNRPMEYDLAPL